MHEPPVREGHEALPPHPTPKAPAPSPPACLLLRSDSVPKTNHGLQDLAQFGRMVDCEDYGAVHGFVLERDGDSNVRFWVRSIEPHC